MNVNECSNGGIILKKGRILIGLTACMLCLSGCTSAISLTENEENVIAEYLAQALLRSDENYTESLIEPTPTPTETPTPTQTMAPSPVITETVNAPLESGDSAASSNKQANADFAQVIGIDGISTEYVRYDIISSVTDESFSVDLRTQDMFVVSFSITNQTSKDIDLDLGPLNISYKLNLDVKKNVKPLITIFEDDLRYLDTTIKGNDTIYAVVIFGVDKNVTFDTSNVIISRDDKTAIIKIK